MSKKSGELAVVDKTAYPVIVDSENAIGVIRDNLAGEEVGEFDLTRIRVPAGGGTNWTVTAIDGSEEALPALEGIIVYIARRRAYWPDANPSGEPPMCVSTDCNTGVGEPGGVCLTCPNNQWGSAIKPDGSTGRGKACKEAKLIFMLRPGNVLPDCVVISPGSLKALRQYQLNLPRGYWSVVTRLSLDKSKNKDGIAYAQVVPACVGQLDQDTAERICAYAQSLQQVFARVVVEPEEVGETAEV